MATPWKTRRFSLEDYRLMGRAGILRDDDRVELLDGEIVEMTPIGPSHAGTVIGLNGLFAARLGRRAMISVQSPVELAGQDSVPQPDLALLRPRADSYRTAHPGADDVLLLVEVMDTSGDRDRELKLPLYARAGIREVWLVDLAAGLVEVHRGPTAHGYREPRRFHRGESMTIEALPDLHIRVDDILG